MRIVIVVCLPIGNGTCLLKRAGEVAALSFSPSEDGFMVNTTWRLRITCKLI